MSSWKNGKLIRVSEPTLKYTPKFIAWAAGFIEGEGSFTRYTPYGGADGRYRIRMSASQKDPEPLLRLQRFLGGSIKPKNCRRIWWEKQRRFIYSSKAWTWRVYGKHAQKAAKLIYPFLSKRRKAQALEILDFHYTNPNPPTNGPKRGSKMPRKTHGNRT